MMGNFIKNNTLTISRVIAQVMLLTFSLKTGLDLYESELSYKIPLIVVVGLICLWGVRVVDQFFLKKYGAKYGKRNRH